MERSADIVCKFGGSSVAEARQIRKIESIVRSDAHRRYVVVSAPGKRNPDDQKITDLLYTCQSLSAEGKSCVRPFRAISNRYLQIDRELGAGSEIHRWLEELRGQLGAGASADLAASRGEYLCARLLAAYLKATFVDAADIIQLDRNDAVADSSYRRIAEQLKGPGLYVIPGFYGSDSTGQIRTFSRGGSDITGALVAAAVHAREYENWTDVSGLLKADPKIVRDPGPMAEVTYREIRELAFMGAKVLHEEAILPLYDQEIPIHIRNTDRPEDPGTAILAERSSKVQPIAGVAGRKGIGLVYLEKYLLRKDPQHRLKILQIFADCGVDLEWERAGIDSLALLVSAKQLETVREMLGKAIVGEFNPDHLEIADNMAVIAVVGEGLADRTDITANVLRRLSQQGIRVRMIDQGSSRISVLLVVNAGDFNRSVATIHDAID
jgi:aspartate kinase